MGGRGFPPPLTPTYGVREGFFSVPPSWAISRVTGGGVGQTGPKNSARYYGSPYTLALSPPCANQDVRST